MLVGAFAAIGGTEIRDARGADVGASRLAIGLHEVAVACKLPLPCLTLTDRVIKMQPTLHCPSPDCLIGAGTERNQVGRKR